MQLDSFRAGQSRVANMLLFLLVVSVAINYLDCGALSVSAPLITGDVLFSAFFWSYASFQLVAGWLVDRYPIDWIYAGAFPVWSLTTAAVSLVHSFHARLRARLLLGVGESVAYPASSQIIVRYFPEERRGFANALVDAGSKPGPGLSTLLGGLAVDRYGWRGMFIAVGLGSLLWLIPWWHVKAPGRGPRGPEWGQILGLRQLWGTSLGMFALGYILYFPLSWLPSYLVRERGLSMSGMALLGSAPFWAMGLSSLAGGWTDLWVKAGWDSATVRKTYAVGGLFLCAILIIPAPAVANPAHSVSLITAAHAALGLFTSNVWAISQTLAGPLAADRWTGIQNAIGNLGGVVSPVLTGWIVSETGSFLLAFWVAAGVLFAGSAAYLMMLGKVRPIDWPASATAAMVRA